MKSRPAEKQHVISYLATRRSSDGLSLTFLRERERERLVVIETIMIMSVEFHATIVRHAPTCKALLITENKITKVGV